MANSFQIQVQGFDALKRALKDLPTEKMEQIEAEIEGSAFTIVAGAKSRVPKDLGQLLGAITFRPIREATVEIVAQKFYAPYVEFGTGANAANYLSSQDEELSAYAKQFYVNGQGRMRPTPFLFPAFYAEKQLLIERIKQILIS